jgi:uncharacterized protein
MRTRPTGWVLLLLSCVAFQPSAAPAQDAAADKRRTISVGGQAEISAAPDLAIIAVAVETTAPKATDAVSDNAKRSNAVATAVKALLGKDDKVTTTRYSLEPHYQAAKTGESVEPHITGYIAHNEVQIETHKVDAVGGLIDAANAAGANRISGLQFTLSDRNEQLRAALAKAGAEARAQAESVATALGVKLGPVLSANTSTGPLPPPRRFEVRSMAALEARAPTTVEPGSVSVSANLQVTYEIE